MKWATRRRLAYALGLLFAFLAVGGYSLFLRLYNPPTCSDSKQNQGEQGVDCGGPCSTVCEASVQNPIVLWARPFKVAEGVYNAAAYIENPNATYGSPQALYVFKLYDANNILVSEIHGSTYISPNEKFAVFASRVQTGSRVPVAAFFQFRQFAPWVSIDMSKKPVVFVRAPSFSDASSSPRATAVLQNGTLDPISNIDVAAILYDKDQNAIAASATHVDLLPKDVSYNLTFTWSAPFTANVARMEVIPRINPFPN